MANSTSITYRLKRKILTFTNKISLRLSKPDRKFTADMVYGILTSRSCLLTDIFDQLHETVRKVDAVKRLSNHLSDGTPASAASSYLYTVKRLVPSEPVVLIDHEMRKTRAYKEDIGKYTNMTYAVLEDEHYYICRDGRELRHIRTESKEQDGYTQTVEAYSCSDCSGCEHKSRCLCKYNSEKIRTGIRL